MSKEETYKLKQQVEKETGLSWLALELLFVSFAKSQKGKSSPE